MASRRPIVYVSGYLMELPLNDGVTGAVRLLFEQNDDQVRQEFLRLVNPILEAIKK